MHRMHLLTAIGIVLGLGCGSESDSRMMDREDSTRSEPSNEAAAGDGSEPDAGAGDASLADAGSDDGESSESSSDPESAEDDESAEADEGDEEYPLAMDECDLETDYTGDEYCILPPPADEGFQLHIGPDDYEDPAAQYILMPGQESTDDFPAVSGNDEDIYFLYRQFRMRPGAHHMIVTATTDGSTFGGRRIGTANISLDSPEGGVIPPENESVGVPLDAKSDLNVSLHSINVTDEPILRELWVNFWYRDSEVVTEEARQLFEIGDASFSVAPGEETILGPYSCEITGEGRMLWFYGHRHANNVRFSAWRVRGDQRDLFYEAYDWEDPLLLEYTSLRENPEADRERGIEGGWSGVLDLQEGDRLEWECHVINENETALRFTNETYLGEMCIMDGEMVGVDCVSSGGGVPFEGSP